VAVLRRLHMGLLWLLAGIAAVMLPVIAIVIICDVMLRDLGFQPLSWAEQSVEYGLLYIAVLSGPLITHEKGHVFVGSLRGAVTPRLRRIMEKFAAFCCTAVCGFLSWYLFFFTRRLYLTGILDAKEFDMPRWLVIGPVFLGFLLMTIEFLIFLLGRESMYRETESTGL
jgi:TRAP-type C4-dicarboxylate transport system permease small subunit